jgi:hypothetical protein
VTDNNPVMRTRPHRPRTILGIALLIAILAAGAYVFTASNTIPSSTAGSGSGTVSGYTASNISYTLASDPTTIDTVTFTISPTTAATVKVKGGTAGPWKTCANSSGTITCDYSAAPISLAAIDQLTVVAVA